MDFVASCERVSVGKTVTMFLLHFTGVGLKVAVWCCKGTALLS